jgi:carboxymethylenebutenolidase
VTDIRTETVAFGTNGATASGFLARPEGNGPFPGVIVVQEWWGVDDHIRDVTLRFAREGFVALAPDLYGGKVANEPSEAQKMMMSLDMNRASRELTKGADYLASRRFLAGRSVGAIGFCMGGGLALTLACDSPQIKAVAPFYGMNPSPIDKVQNLRGPVFAAYAEHDAFAGPEVQEKLKQALEQYGKKHEVKVYPGTEHAFFNDTRKEVYAQRAANDAWNRVLTLFRENL